MDTTLLYRNLPPIFAGLMGPSISIYVVLDGFDLGVGILYAVAKDKDKDKDRTIASIGPIWEANEIWLVLAIGILLVALPVAHGVILKALYLPVAIILISLIVALCLTATYAAIGSAWLIYKTEGDLQKRAVGWMQRSLLFTLISLGIISLATPFASPRIFEKWFSPHDIVALLPHPIMTLGLFGFLFWKLLYLPGLAYSFYPFVVTDRMTIY